MKLDELSVPWCHGYARVHLQRCAVETSAPGDRLQSLTSVCSQLGLYDSKSQMRFMII